VVALIAIGQHGVRDGELFEALLGRLVTRISVRVPLEGELAIGRLDLDVGGVALDGERLVMVARQRITVPWRGLYASLDLSVALSLDLS
jgi:hypothetical protein